MSDYQINCIQKSRTESKRSSIFSPLTFSYKANTIIRPCYKSNPITASEKTTKKINMFNKKEKIKSHHHPPEYINNINVLNNARRFSIQKQLIHHSKHLSYNQYNT